MGAIDHRAGRIAFLLVVERWLPLSHALFPPFNGAGAAPPPFK